ncbi:MAG: thioredoxin family protein [Halobacteriales archaeon]|nr:thioredoxin family protein [Halobacteriales archaeon]
MANAENIVPVDDGDYEQTIENERLVLLYYWADWCGPCHALTPVLNELATEHPGLVIARLDADENETAVEDYGVESIPTMILFKNGEPVEVFVGKVPYAKLESGVENYK